MFKKQFYINILYDIIAHLVRLAPYRKISNTVLLIKTNEIGDYILWRNTLPYIRKSKVFKKQNITLLGNIAWKNLFEELDKENVDKTIWIDKSKFKKNLYYRYQLLKKIRKAGFSTVINTVISRCKREDDAFVAVTNDAIKIGNKSDLTNVQSFEIGYDKNMYTKLISSEKRIFEFYKNVDFTEQLLEENLTEIKFKLDGELPKYEALENKKYFVVFTGSSRPEKIWPTEYFVEVAKFITDTYKLCPVLCGSNSDEKYISAFMKVYPDPKIAINLCGKTSLIQFAGILKNAGLLVSIDTGAVHIAAAVGCPVFAIFNGTRLGRFAPYPKEISKTFYSVFPDGIETAINNNDYLEYQKISTLLYKDVTKEKMINTIKSILTKN